MVAAKNVVVAPMKVTKACAVGARSNNGESRATMNTPAVTMVAAWISAETGVGPSIASGSQVCSRNCADLPMAPINSRKHINVSASTSHDRKWMVLPVSAGACANTVSRSSAPVIRNAANMPSEKPKSPTRLTMKALIAAAFASGLWYQKPMSR